MDKSLERVGVASLSRGSGCSHVQILCSTCNHAIVKVVYFTVLLLAKSKIRSWFAKILLVAGEMIARLENCS